MKKLLLFFILFGSLAQAQPAVPRSFRNNKIGTDTLTGATANSYLLINDTVRIKNFMDFDSLANQSLPSYGFGRLYSKGTAGLFYGTGTSRVRLDTSYTGAFLTPSDSILIRNYSNSLYLKNADSTSIRNYSTTLYKGAGDSTAGTGYFTVNKAALKAPLASPTFSGTITTALGAGTVRSSAGGVLSSTASDTVGLAAALAGKQASGTYLVPSDSTAIRNYSATLYEPKFSPLTSGSIPFSNGTTLTQDNTAFSWSSANKKLSILKTISSSGGAENNDGLNSTLVGNQTESAYSTFGGSGITARTKVGLAAAATGTFNAVVGHIKTFDTANDSNETGAGYFDNSLDTNKAGTQYGIDVVTQTGKVQPNFMVGISSLVNNFYNGTSKRGMYGLSVVTRPVATGDNSAQYSGRTNYKIDALAAIGGWVGASYGARTSAAKDGLRIGGLVSNWQGQSELSALDTAINARDYSTAGVYLHDPFVAGTPAILISANGGNIGLGLTNPGSKNKLDIYTTDTTTSSTVIGANIVVENSPGGTSTAIMRGISTVPQVQSANANNVSRLDGIRSAPTHAGSGTVTDIYGGLFVPTKSSTGAVTNAYGGFFRVDNTNASGAITNGYGVFIPAFTATGAITNAWGVYQSGTGGGNYFAANTSIGSTTTTSQFNVGSAAQYQINSSGAVVKDNGVTQPSTEHWQFAPYSDTVARTGLTASVGATNLNNTSTNGLYRVSVYLYNTTNNGTSTVTASIKWGDGATQTVTSGTVNNSTLGSYASINGQICRVTNSTAITWQADLTGTIGTAVFEVDVIAERLW